MRSTRIKMMAVAIVAAAGATAQADPADYTAIGVSGEPSLAQILRDAYGPTGVVTFGGPDGVDMTLTVAGPGGYTITASRIRDMNGTSPLAIASPSATAQDTVFQDGLIQSQGRARYSSRDQWAGYVNGVGAGAFNDMFVVTQGLHAYGNLAQFSDTISSQFQFARSDTQGGSSVNYSNTANNAGVDMMVSFRLTDSRGALGINGGQTTYLFGFEDSPGGDHDYNDLVMELSVVPLPTAAYAGFGALIGVAGLRRLRRRAQNA